MKIDRAHYDELVAHALEDAPNECCGLVAAQGGVVRAVYRARNVHASPLRYEIDAAEMFRLLDEIERTGCELGAIYHSHTRSDPYPSQTDLGIAVRGNPPAAQWPGTLYIIIGVASPAEPEVRTYRIDGDGVEEVALSVQ
jgi:proteasome lid subunit RPN8/RPN11